MTVWLSGCLTDWLIFAQTKGTTKGLGNIKDKRWIKRLTRAKTSSSSSHIGLMNYSKSFQSSDFDSWKPRKLLPCASVRVRLCLSVCVCVCANTCIFILHRFHTRREYRWYGDYRSKCEWSCWWSRISYCRYCLVESERRLVLGGERGMEVEWPNEWMNEKCGWITRKNKIPFISSLQIQPFSERNYSYWVSYTNTDADNGDRTVLDEGDSSQRYSNQIAFLGTGIGGLLSPFVSLLWTGDKYIYLLFYLVHYSG